MSTASEKAACAWREFKQRERVYARLVEQGRMTQALANKELRLMEEIARDYDAQAEGERLL